MAKQKRERHPLDDEGITVVVSLTHGFTLQASVGTATSYEGYSVSEAIESAGQEALDGMLAQLEVIGG